MARLAGEAYFLYGREQRRYHLFQELQIQLFDRWGPLTFNLLRTEAGTASPMDPRLSFSAVHPRLWLSPFLSSGANCLPPVSAAGVASPRSPGPVSSFSGYAGNIVELLSKLLAVLLDHAITSTLRLRCIADFA